MATIEKRGQFWRVKIRRAGLPAQTRTFDNKTQAQQGGVIKRFDCYPEGSIIFAQLGVQTNLDAALSH